MAADLTDRQIEIAEFIRKFLAKHAYAPTVREIGDALGIQSTNGVNDHLLALAGKEVIDWAPTKARSLRITAKGQRLLARARGEKVSRSIVMFKEGNLWNFEVLIERADAGTVKSVTAGRGSIGWSSITEESAKSMVAQMFEVPVTAIEVRRPVSAPSARTEVHHGR